MTRMEGIHYEALSWMDVERRLRTDVRLVLPLGATEEHGHLSLLTDTLFVDRVAREACRRAGVLTAPVLPFGCSAFAVRFPGTLSLRTETLCRVVEDLVDCTYRQGFRRLVFVTGHGGNEVATGVLSEVQLDRPSLAIHYRNAWEGMMPLVRRVEAERGLPAGEHASWMEAFPFARTGPVPHAVRDAVDTPDFPLFPLNPRTAREHLGDGVVGGASTLGDDALLDEAMEACVGSLAAFLDTLPADAPPT
jgi:creatinine amidohydrolase